MERRRAAKGEGTRGELPVRKEKRKREKGKERKKKKRIVKIEEHERFSRTRC